jgi:tripeptidyl-peptidase-1
MLLQFVVLALTSSLILASPLSPVYSEVQTKREVPSTHSLHERHLPLWSHQWTRKSKVPDTKILPMRIGLKQRNLEAGHDKLMEM